MKRVVYLAYLMITLLLPVIGHTQPPSMIPSDLWNAYTLNGQISVSYLYFDNTYTNPLVYSQELINSYIQKALNRENNYYGITDAYLYQALDEMASQIKGKEVAIIGSALPWYESILLAYGACPVVIEYNPIVCSDSRITYLQPHQYWKNPRQFDLILSISSIEHDGLGRYGDPLDPNGDLRSMVEMKKMLNPQGKLIIAFPVGQDHLIWNAHRIYGPIRLKMLFEGWKPVKYYGFFCEHMLPGGTGLPYQPVFLLTPK